MIATPDNGAGCSTTVENSAHHREFAGEDSSGEQSPNHRQAAEQRRGGVVDIWSRTDFITFRCTASFSPTESADT